MSITTEIQRLQTAKADIKTAIEAKGVTIGSSTKIDSYPTYINQIQTFDPYNGHAYVEIGGLKWATMNIGATGITDAGLYFQWGDTTGYLSGSVGTNTTALKKPFSWADYKYGNGTSSPGANGMTKYNSGDTKTVLDLSDDAARANWGGNWRMPTLDDFNALKDTTTNAWVTDYQGSGVNGRLFTDKNDSSKVLFFPAAGRCNDGSMKYVGSYGYYWSSSLDTSGVINGCYLVSSSGSCRIDFSQRRSGCAVRGVVG